MKNNKIVWWQIVLLVIAGMINATGVTLLLYPAQVIDGGISGLSVLLSTLTKIPIAVFIVCINLPFFVIGFKRLGWRFILCSAISITFYALFSFLYQVVWKLDVKMFQMLGGDMFLCAVFGGIISGIGSGLTIKMRGAIDGIEVMAVLFAKKLTMTVGTFVMVFNAFMYVAACFLLNNFIIGLYSIVAYAIGLKAVDFIVDGFDKAKGCIIVTTKAKQIGKEISANIGRSATLIDSQGYYSGEKKTMLYCAVNRFEIGRLKAIVAEVDPMAFVTISDISEIIGTKTKFEISAPPKNKRAKLVETAENSAVNEAPENSDGPTA